MGDVADELDKKGVKVAEFKSSPAKPRLDLLEDHQVTLDHSSGRFTPTVTQSESFLHTYNCNWEAFPRKNDLSHRRKQMFRPDYVHLHYVHYSTITSVSQMSEKESKSAGEQWSHRYKEAHQYTLDEENEATMLHAKTKTAIKTYSWKSTCKRISFMGG